MTHEINAEEARRRQADASFGDDVLLTDQAFNAQSTGSLFSTFFEKMLTLITGFIVVDADLSERSAILEGRRADHGPINNIYEPPSDDHSTEITSAPGAPSTTEIAAADARSEFSSVAAAPVETTHAPQPAAPAVTSNAQ